MLNPCVPYRNAPLVVLTCIVSPPNSIVSNRTPKTNKTAALSSSTCSSSSSPSSSSTTSSTHLLTNSSVPSSIMPRRFQSGLLVSAEEMNLNDTNDFVLRVRSCSHGRSSSSSSPLHAMSQPTLLPTFARLSSFQLFACSAGDGGCPFPL